MEISISLGNDLGKGSGKGLLKVKGRFCGMAWGRGKVWERFG